MRGGELEQPAFAGERGEDGAELAGRIGQRGDRALDAGIADVDIHQHVGRGAAGPQRGGAGDRDRGAGGQGLGDDGERRGVGGRDVRRGRGDGGVVVFEGFGDGVVRIRLHHEPEAARRARQADTQALLDVGAAGKDAREIRRTEDRVIADGGIGREQDALGEWPAGIGGTLVRQEDANVNPRIGLRARGRIEQGDGEIGLFNIRDGDSRRRGIVAGGGGGEDDGLIALRDAVIDRLDREGRGRLPGGDRDARGDDQFRRGSGK